MTVAPLKSSLNSLQLKIDMAAYVEVIKVPQ